MKNHVKALIVTGVICFLTRILSAQPDGDLTHLVNPLVGSAEHGHTFPGATVPFGMVQLSPDTRLSGWDGCSGYHYSDSLIYGFTHTHLNGTGCSDYGDILLMPFSGKGSINNSKYASLFRHSREIAHPGYYQVFLEKDKILAEMTASIRTGFHQFTFEPDSETGILLDLKHRDEVLDAYLEISGPDEICGLRRSKAWAEDQYVYFCIKFSKAIVSYSIFTDDQLQKSIQKAEGKNLKVLIFFGKAGEIPLMVKVGISAVSVDGARKNLEVENPGWDFIAVRQKAEEAWQNELSKILVKGGTDDQQRTFYSNLYLCMLSPNVYMDVDGQFRGTDLKIHKAEGFTNYTVFSLWDTFRALHPLLTIIEQKRTTDFINTFLAQYEFGGLLPVWELSGNETFCMIGYHSIPVIADAYVKGIGGFDVEKALKAMESSAMANRYGLQAYREFQYIPGDLEHESVSKTLEYAYDDWCIAQMAHKMGENEDYQTYIRRAQSYKNLLDPNSGFMRARVNGQWYSPFDPTEVNFNYTEANAWQYSFFVPHDISGLMNRMGGPQKLSARLDTLFSARQDVSGREQVDITGLIGQYAHGNEPSHHMSYLYNYTGEPQKTQQLVRRIMADLYNSRPDGQCGNNDCGQMSAWYVLSAMGFYQVCPGDENYAIGSPIFDKVTINLENGKHFIISTSNNSKSNIYISGASLNGKPWNKSYFAHSELMKGGEIHFEMSSVRSLTRGVKPEDIPVTRINDFPIVLSPYFEAVSNSFKEKLEVAIKSSDEESDIFYSSDGSDPIHGTKYSVPVLIDTTTLFKAVVVYPKLGVSPVTTACFIKVKSNLSIRLFTEYVRQYSAGGPEGLIDGIRGTTDWRLGHWQGYQGNDFEAIIDLSSVQKISKVGAEFLQDTRSWIVMPAEMEVEMSVDGNGFLQAGAVNHQVNANDYTVQVHELLLEKPMEARYIKIKVKNFGKLPEWHLSAGENAFIFIDEVIVE